MRHFTPIKCPFKYADTHFWKRKASLMLTFKCGVVLAGMSLQSIDTLAFSQSATHYNQRILLATALKKVEGKTGLVFFYRSADIKDIWVMDPNLVNKTNQAVLEDLFSQIPFQYTIKGNTVAINRVNKLKPISGIVKDAKGDPIAGASITVKGTAKGTSTGPDGGFSLEVSEGEILLIRAVGYEILEVPVANLAQLKNIVLKQQTQVLEEMVVVGYGTQKKAVVSGAIASVKGEELAKSSSVNLSNSFAGRLPGVTAMQNSGEPGGDGSTLRIRGINSLSGGNSSPLIVIDGVPSRAGGIDRINPNDVESVSVLKDASAAIYGSRAGNGVILITTKQGKMGKPRFTYDFTYGLQRPTRTPKMANSAQYTDIINEVTKVYPEDPSQWSAIWKALNTGTGIYNGPSKTVESTYTPADRQKYMDGSDPLRYPNTDWFSATMRDWAPQQRHNLQITGGTENTKYLVSLGYLDQDAIYKNSATYYKQYDLRTNFEFKLNDYITARLAITGREESRNYPTRSAGTIFRFLVRGLPTNIATWPNGLPGPDLEQGANPVVITTGDTGYDRNTRDYLQNTGSIDVKIPGVKGLKLTGTASIDKYWGRSKRWETPWTLYDWDKITFEADGVTPKLTARVPAGIERKAQLREAQEDQLAVNLSALLSYDTSLKGGHNISTIAGLTREKVTNNGFFANRMDFPSAQVEQLNFGDRERQTMGNENVYDRARLSYYGRFNYNYNEKYLIEFNWRVDGSYVFPEDGRFGFFPGVSAGWRISEENFFKNNVSFVNNLKLRASWGQMGAEAYYGGSLQEYKYLSLMNTGSGVFNDRVFQTLYESDIPNRYFTWEVANNSNVGLEALFLNNRLNLELDYFYNKRTSVLTKNPGQIPESSGIAGNLPIANLGNLINKGYEFKLTYTDKIGEVSYNVGVNGGYARNNVQYSSDVANTPQHQRQIGKVTDSWLVYLYDGVFRDQAAIDANTIDYSGLGQNKLRPGDMKFVDYNGDGKITSDDRVRLNQNGSPTFTGGFNFAAQYKGFDISVLLQGATGGLRRIASLESGAIGNYLEWSYENRWSIDNPSDKDPRLTNRSDQYYMNDNTYWIRSTNYLRLKNVELGYNLSDDWCKRIGLHSVRLYTNGINLITWDKIKIWDPESDNSAGAYYPQSKIISFGVKVGL
ncbi:SusC/RagA family TonB-linked outer membrane protein [Sphingobacterium detergens]|uniref:TonB-linked SusC/RagA family outer membrane protein n=1 Tax=Sphingobacterium detergens TaxID=1145106 RepID=A0A420BGI1_SPHD1|nr:TonB-dependent receptor [Sphingobacterium detergens]RKE55786.1 TonB-linked SusC/RagA family outer membrane protein [Sphingobacterium detergens]